LEGDSTLTRWIKTLLVTILIILVGIIIFDLVYEPLPISSLSTVEVIDKVNNANGDLVELTADDSYQWYVSDIKNGDENIKRLFQEKGWSFKEKDGTSRYIFQSEQGEISVNGIIYNKKYIFFRFPKGI
jgi:hypothetical protein